MSTTFSIQTRTGVNTGEVIVGDPSTGDTLVTGVTPRTWLLGWSRSRNPASVLIGPETHRPRA